MLLKMLILIGLLHGGSLRAQSIWEIPRLEREIQIDGFLDDWQGIPALSLTPGSSGVRVNGPLTAEDLSFEIRAAWNPEALYLAIRWQDDVWDIQEVSRSEAVWVGPDRRRRERLFFFDNFRFQIREADYNYLLWVSPRVDGQGPHGWNRLLRGLRGLEAAASPPMISARQNGQEVTMEIVLSWDALRINPRRQQVLTMSLAVSDSDTPGRMLEAKAPHLKWVEWNGSWRLAQ